MIDYTSFIIDFYVTVSNNVPVTTVVTVPSAPSTSSVSASINELITYLKTNVVNLTNYQLISKTVGEIVTKLSSSSSIQVQASLTTLQSSISDSSSLTSALNGLNSALASSSSSTGSTSTTTSTTTSYPETDTTTAPAPQSTGNIRNRRGTTTTSVTKFKGLGQKVAGMQTNSSTSSTYMSTLLAKLKPAVQSLATGSTTTGSTTTSTTTTTALTSQNQRIANIVNTSGTTAQGNPNNIINNFVASLIPLRPRGTRAAAAATVTLPTSITDLTTLQPPAPSTDPTASTSAVSEATDYYEISTSQSVSPTGLLNVIFAYYPANSTTSSFACTYYLTPASLFYLSSNALSKASTMTSAQKSQLADNSGLSTSTSPSNQDVWDSYLIWLLSFLSFGVASQLGFSTLTLPYPGTTTGSANYMMSREYMELVGNFGLTIQTSTMDSDNAALVSTAIPQEWPSMMYSSDFGSNTYGAYSYAAQSVNASMTKQTSTTTTTSTTA